jgi:hypothetical protein
MRLVDSAREKGSAAQNWNSQRKTGICIADQAICRSFGDSHRIQPSLSLRRRVVRDYHPPPNNLTELCAV